MADDEKTTYVSFDELLKFETDAFIAMGVPEKDAKICAEVLFEADKRGIDSHGVGRLFMYYVRIKRGQQKAETKIDVIREKPGIISLEANNGMGMPVSHYAMKKAIEKAKQNGIGMAVVAQSNHYGIAGYYTLMAAEEGCIGICGTNARPSIAPTWGLEPRLGTNPLTISLPTNLGFHWFADHATSIAQRGKIEQYARLNKHIPKGWVIDINGNEPTDANEILKMMLEEKAALNPLGGTTELTGSHKGYNYATFVEIMSAGLNSANFLNQCIGFRYNDKGEKEILPYNLGHFFIAIDIEAFVPLEDFKKKVTEMLEQIKSAKVNPNSPAGKIWVAGEKEFETIKKRAKEGVPVVAATQLQLLQIAKETGMDLSKYNIDWKVEYTGEADAQGW